VPKADPVPGLLRMPLNELERQVALVYEQGLIALQQRMHPPPPESAPSPGILLHPPPGRTSDPGEGEAPTELAEHGRKIARAIFEPIRDDLCEDLRGHPGAYRQGPPAVRRLAARCTRVDPPDELFLMAACWLWREGLEKFCANEAPIA
jgi:hypothetical protein